MNFQIQNIAGGTDKAKRTRIVDGEAVAINSAKATSEFFHGVFEVKADAGAVVGYFVNGRRYRKLDTAWAAR